MQPYRFQSYTLLSRIQWLTLTFCGFFTIRIKQKHWVRLFVMVKISLACLPLFKQRIYTKILCLSLSKMSSSRNIASDFTLWFWFPNFTSQSVLVFAYLSQICETCTFTDKTYIQILFVLNKRYRTQVCPWWRASNWRRCHVVRLSHKWRLLFNPRLLIFFTEINLCRWNTFAPVVWRLRWCCPSY